MASGTKSRKVDFKFNKGEKVEDIKKGEDGIFTVATSKACYRAHAVVLAIGKGGTPRKLGVKGEDLPKVMYRLIETDHYLNKKILVVGGGDSAVEAAMGHITAGFPTDCSICSAESPWLCGQTSPSP